MPILGTLSMRRVAVVCATVLTVCFGSNVDAKSDSPADRFEHGVQFYQRGEFERAATIWQEVADESKRKDTKLSLRATIGFASACLKMGLYAQADQALRQANPLLANSSRDLIAQYFQQAGNVRLAAHQHEQSLEAFSQAVASARQSGNKQLQAAIFNDYGNALTVSGYATDALTAFQNALALAKELNSTRIELGATLNITRLQLQREELASAREALHEARRLLASETTSYETSMLLFALADLERTLGVSLTTDELAVRRDQLQTAERTAVASGNVRFASLAYGYEARSHVDAKAYASAEPLLRKAMFYAAQGQAPDILYQWQWQLGNVLRQQRKDGEAVESFGMAVSTLTPIRQELLNGYHDSYAFFQQNIRPVYLDYVDILLKRADGEEDAAKQHAAHNRAREALETLKSAELQDYFRDECVVAQESQSLRLEQVGSDSAVLYPIVLADRVELLLSVNGQFHRRSSTVDQVQLLEAASRFREYLQEPGNDRYLPYANRLYRWLIEPIKQQLVAAGVDTLVIIPDGVLRTIPFASLHNGDRFLIEEWAVAVTPSLKLTAAPKVQAARANALLAGVAQSVQGFAPLPQVNAELSNIRDQFGGKLLSNREYTKENLQAALSASDYNIVHMATHSVVGATPAESFLLTYDGKLTMGDLGYLLRIGEFRKQPIELLTLSACETAVGDERAALGLAGIAVKSGARSVVASLWLVDDQATAQLMSRFYRSLSLRSEGNGSTAKALRSAQLQMLAEPATEHPAHWAAFMMIGNWQ